MEKKWTSLKWIKLRILIVSCCFIVSLGLILFRSYQLRILRNSRVDRLASRQYQATLSVNPKRGTIYDRTGKILAMDVEVASIAIHPSQIEDPEAVLKLLSQYLDVPKNTLKKKIHRKSKFAWVERRISSNVGRKIEEARLKGVSVITEFKRFYPNNELAGPVLGAVGYDAKALGGIEFTMDPYLKSSASKLIAKKDAKGRLYTPTTNSGDYHDVYLTLDTNIQFVAERQLWKMAEEYKAKSGFAVVSKVDSGDVLAMANYPKFNPNVYWKYPLAQWKNHAIMDSYEPGSTFKTILAASALESGKVHVTDRFNCENGRLKIGEFVIKDHAPYSQLNVSDIIKYSSNIGVTKISQTIGREFFYKKIIDFGFDEKTGINLPGEEDGRVQHFSKWMPVDQSNIAFGQGLAISGLQMVRAYGALANKGVMKAPKIIAKIESSSGEVLPEKNDADGRQVVTSWTAAQVTKMLEQVVKQGGTGTRAALDGYAVAGKTGTAQKINSRTGSYDAKNYVSSFIGYVPADNPQYVVYVVFDSPQPVYAGALVAAPVFKEIASYVLTHTGVAPKETRMAHVVH